MGHSLYPWVRTPQKEHICSLGDPMEQEALFPHGAFDLPSPFSNFQGEVMLTFSSLPLRWQGRVTFPFSSHYSHYYPDLSFLPIIPFILSLFLYHRFLIRPLLRTCCITVILTLTICTQTNIIFYGYILTVICMFFSNGPTGPTLSQNYWGESYGRTIYIKWMRLPTSSAVILFYQ